MFVANTSVLSIFHAELCARGVCNPVQTTSH